MTLRVVPIQALLTALGFAILSMAVYRQASRSNPTLIYISAGLFAYTAFAVVARAAIDWYQPAGLGPDAFASWLLYVLLIGVRPYLLVAAAVCLLLAPRLRTQRDRLGGGV